MRQVEIIGSNEQLTYHPDFKAYQCTTQDTFPKRYNGGLNDFHFTESVDFTFVNMPLIPKTVNNHICENENYSWYSCDIQVRDAAGVVIHGVYYITFDKNAKKFISENVNFY